MEVSFIHSSYPMRSSAMGTRRGLEGEGRPGMARARVPSHGPRRSERSGVSCRPAGKESQATTGLAEGSWKCPRASLRGRSSSEHPAAAPITADPLPHRAPRTRASRTTHPLPRILCRGILCLPLAKTSLWMPRHRQENRHNRLAPGTRLASLRFPSPTPPPASPHRATSGTELPTV